MHACIHLSISKSYFISRFQLQTCILYPHQVFIFISFKTCFNTLLFHLFWYILTYKSKIKSLFQTGLRYSNLSFLLQNFRLGYQVSVDRSEELSKNHFHIKNLCMSVRHEERSKVDNVTFDRPTWSYFFQKAQNILLLVERSKVDSVTFDRPTSESFFQT